MSENIMHWRRGDGEIARMYGEIEVMKDSAPVFDVDQDTIGLLFCNGRTQTLTTGRHDLLSLCGADAWYKVKPFYRPKMKVFVADAGILGTEFSVQGLRTSDGLTVALECRAQVRIENVERFFLNLNKSADSLSPADLGGQMAMLLRAPLHEQFKDQSIKDLAENPNVLDLLRQAKAALDQELRTFGLALVDIVFLGVTHARYNELLERQEDLVVTVWEKEGELARRKTLAELDIQEEMQAVSEMEDKASVAEKRLGVLDRLAKTAMQEEVARLRNEAELRKFVNQADIERILDDKEKDDLVRRLTEEGEEHEFSRRHMLAKLAVEQRYELERMQFGHQSQLDEDVLRQKLKLAHLELEEQIANERLVRGAQIEEENKLRERDLAFSLQGAENDVRIKAIEFEQDKLEALFGQELLDMQKARRQADEIHAQKLKEQDELHQLELRLREKNEDHNRHLEYLKTMAGLPPEALVVAAKNPDQAAMLVEMHQATAMKGQSAEQILAMQAGKSAEAAKAFQERYKAEGGSASNEQTNQMMMMFMQMLMNQQAGGAGAEQMERIIAMQQGDKGAQWDVIKDFMGNMAKMTGGVAPGGGPGPEQQPGGRFCPACGKKVEPRAKFCGQCGERLE